MADPLMGMPAPQAAQPQPSPQQGAVDATPEEEAAYEDTFENIVAGLLEHINKPDVAKGLIEEIKKSDNTARSAGQIVFGLMEPAAKQAEQAGREIDMEMLLAAAAKILDSLMQRLMAAKVEIPDEEAWSLEAIMSALQAYAATAPEGSEDQAQAQAMLVQMQQDGSVQEGASTLQQIGQKHGVDPFAPKQKPMAQGVKAGLMGG